MRPEIHWDQRQVAYDFPLRPGMIVKIALPVRLTTGEAERITRFIEALAVPEVVEEVTPTAPTPFGLTAEYIDRDWEDEPTRGWHVHLPHQCDSWDIAGEWSDPVPRDVAIVELERFIAEAQSALETLRAAPKETDQP